MLKQPTPYQIQAIKQHWDMDPSTPLQPEKIHQLPKTKREPMHTLLPPVGDSVHAKNARKVMNVLLSAHALDLKLARDHLGDVLVRPSQRLLNAIRQELQYRLDALAKSANALYPDIPETEQFRIQCQLNNLLCYAAFFEYPEGSTIRLPYFNGKYYTLLDYKVEQLPLTPSWMSGPYCAYGLVPVHDKTAPSQLLFMGTTYPGSKGMLWTLLADSTPFASVGRLLFRLGRKTLDNWMAKQSKVQCHGQSLGGAMVLQAAERYGNKLEGYAMVPAGLKKPGRDGSNVTIIYGGNDKISLVGQTPDNARYVYVLPAQYCADKGRLHQAAHTNIRGAIASHALGLASQEHAEIFLVDDKHMLKGHAKRGLMRKLQKVSWALLFPGLVLAMLGASIGKWIAKGLHKLALWLGAHETEPPFRPAPTAVCLPRPLSPISSSRTDLLWQASTHAQQRRQQAATSRRHRRRERSKPYYRRSRAATL